MKSRFHHCIHTVCGVSVLTQIFYFSFWANLATLKHSSFDIQSIAHDSSGRLEQVHETQWPDAALEIVVGIARSPDSCSHPTLPRSSWKWISRSKVLAILRSHIFMKHGKSYPWISDSNQTSLANEGIYKCYWKFSEACEHSLLVQCYIIFKSSREDIYTHVRDEA